MLSRKGIARYGGGYVSHWAATRLVLEVGSQLPLREHKTPHPENPGNNLAHPGPVVKKIAINY